LALGRLLLDRGDDEGLRWLDEAMEGDPAVFPACELAYEYLRDRDRDEEAETYRSRLGEQAEVFFEAATERSEVSVDDRLDPPDLPDAAVEDVRRTLGAHKEVATAYLARKRTRHSDDARPLHVLAVVPTSSRRTAWKEAGDDVVPLELRILDELSLSAELMVVKVDRKSPLAAHFARVEGARIYTRE
jgi:hypothetical protein